MSLETIRSAEHNPIVGIPSDGARRMLKVQDRSFAHHITGAQETDCRSLSAELVNDPAMAELLPRLVDSTPDTVGLWLFLRSSRFCNLMRSRALHVQTIATASLRLRDDATFCHTASVTGEWVRMANAIGLRCYLITAQRERDARPLEFDDDFEFDFSPARFLKNFVETNSDSVRDSDRERSWYFEPKAVGTTEGSSKGYIHYGTYGFESNFVNSRTKKKQYRRKVDDVEEIPLFYEFWRPKGADYAFAVFQSFAGRSCVTIVTEKIEEAFRVANEGYTLKFKKLVPTDSSGGVYADAPVKQLRFIRRNASSDIADRYIGESSKPIDMELLLKARRKQSLGPFGAISRNLKRSERAGAIIYDGVEFGEAIANIRVGGKYRPIGIFGISSDAGVIDVTSDVKRGADGHPLFDSIESQVKQILSYFNRTVASRMR